MVKENNTTIQKIHIYFFFFKGEVISTEMVDSLPNVEHKNFSESLGNCKIFHSDSYLKWNKRCLNEGGNDSVVVEITSDDFYYVNPYTT